MELLTATGCLKDCCLSLQSTLLFLHLCLPLLFWLNGHLRLQQTLQQIHQFNIQIKITVLWCMVEHMNTSVAPCLFLSIKLQWVCSLAMLLKGMITVGSKCDAFAGEVDESHQQASRPDCIFCMSRQNMCQRKGPLSIPLWVECVTLDGLFIKCFIYSFAVRTKWLNITRNWRDWPEDKPLCSKFKNNYSIFMIEIDLSLANELVCPLRTITSDATVLQHLHQTILMCLHCGGCCYKRWLLQARMCHQLEEMLLE